MTNISKEQQLKQLIELIKEKFEIEDRIKWNDDYGIGIRLDDKLVSLNTKIKEYIETVESPMMKPIKHENKSEEKI